jgi:hypothetical protein
VLIFGLGRGCLQKHESCTSPASLFPSRTSKELKEFVGKVQQIPERQIIGTASVHTSFDIFDVLTESMAINAGLSPPLARNPLPGHKHSTAERPTVEPSLAIPQQQSPGRRPTLTFA